MKVLVTGGVGFIGTNIVNYLSKQGHEAVIFDNFSRSGVELNLKDIGDVKIVRGDVRHKTDLDELDTDFDGIIHLGANPGIPRSIRSPIYDFEVNAGGTLNMLEFARKNGNIPLVYASTNKVYAGDRINGISLTDEETRYDYDADSGYRHIGIPPDFPVDGSEHSPYGCSKLTGDTYCREYYAIYGTPTVVNRMSCIYGKNQIGCEDQGWVAWFVFASILNKSINIYGNGKQVRDMLWGEDVARLYEYELRNIKKFKGKVFNVGGGSPNTLSLIEALDYLNSKRGRKIKLHFYPWRPADHKVYYSDIRKLSDFWKPKVTPSKGLNMLHEWAMENLESIKRIVK